MQKLRTGAAYHGNRMPHHARADLYDMARNHMNLVVHMLSHTDWDRHKTVMKDIVELSYEAGLEVWVDNWGLGGPPGDKSHVLAYYPDSHIYYGNGDMDPIRACLNSPDFRKFTKEWVDAVAFIGGKSIFWDEPHLPLKEVNGKTYVSCCCARCKKLFEDKYNKPMPGEMTPEMNDFRIDGIVDYFREVTEYSASKGIENIVCVMLGTHHGISLETIDRICSLPTLSNIGSDPYWVGSGANPYEFVYNNTLLNLDVCERFGKDHNIWIQSFNNPRSSEEEIVQATEAAYDAGARTIIAWGYYGSTSNDYRAKNPDAAWAAVCAGMERIWNFERDRVLVENRKLVNYKQRG